MKNTLVKYTLPLLLILAGCSQLSSIDQQLMEAQSEETARSVAVVYPTPSRVVNSNDIVDFNKYYKPASFNYDMFDPNAKYSWHRFKQSQHFFVFWEPQFGSNPNSANLPYEMRVDIDDLLAKAEEFYALNVEKLKMCTPGYGRSNLDRYKLQIYVVYQTEWLATGSGYDNVIGALWVNPSTCKPVGKTIAHEVGHTFQYQIYCDRLLNGQANNFTTGWRYGLGPNGSGGNGFWEQSAQFQAYQLYPQLAFEQNYRQFTQNAHRHFNNEMMRYQSFWFMYYFTNKYGIESFSRLWKESYFPEDPLDTYNRVINNNNWSKTWDDYYEYASHAITYDYGYINNYYNPRFSTYNTVMYGNNGKYRPAYSNCPSTSGFNVIRLNTPLKDTTVSVNLNALPVASSLDRNDPGNVVNVDGKVIGHKTTYNDNVYNGTKYTQSYYRYGFVGVKNNKAYYGPMAQGSSGKASMDITQDFDSFYLVVVATPTIYTHHYWNDTEIDDLQWPYEVSFVNTGLQGKPCDGDIAFGVYCNKDKQDYVLGSLDFNSIGVIKKLAHNFNLSEEAVRTSIVQPKFASNVGPSEGQIVLALTEQSGNITYNPTATSGYWCDRNGNANSWGPNSIVFFEYDKATSKFTYGHLPNYTKKGDTYIVHPTFVYRKDGVDYKTVISFYYIYN